MIEKEELPLCLAYLRSLDYLSNRLSLSYYVPVWLHTHPNQFSDIPKAGPGQIDDTCRSKSDLIMVG